MDSIYKKVDVLYTGVYEILKKKKLSQFTLFELKEFTEYYEELFKLIATYMDISSDIEFRYKYTGKIKDDCYTLILAGFKNDIYIDLDAIISLQEELIKDDDYDIDLFVSQIILMASVHETVHLKQEQDRKKGVLALENYIMSKYKYADSILYKKDRSRLLDYYERPDEGEAHFTSISFVIDFFRQTKRMKMVKKLIRDSWTWNNVFSLYYSKLPVSYNNGNLVSNEDKCNEIIKKGISDRNILSFYPVLQLELENNGSSKVIFSVLDKYFYDTDENNKNELLKIYYYIFFSKIKMFPLDFLVEIMIERYGYDNIKDFFEKLYVVTENNLSEYNTCYNTLLNMMGNSYFDLDYVRKYGIKYNRHILECKYQFCINDVYIKQGIIDKILKEIKRFHR